MLPLSSFYIISNITILCAVRVMALDCVALAKSTVILFFNFLINFDIASC
nr:MAG TPA: hypothetical protein [Caudoviricetes sp.]